MTEESASYALESGAIVYPESDGKPIADNTKQFRWIMTIQGGLEAMFREAPDVFVAGTLLWYPVEGDTTICRGPDVMVVFGRPKQERSSYIQWEEGGVVPQVVFEVLSPSNTLKEMSYKFEFYDQYGVEEYYLYDPDRNDLTGWLRSDARLRVIEAIDGWLSPRLGTRFIVAGGELQIIRPDGRPFLTYVGLQMRAEQAEMIAEAERERAEAERERAEAERERAERLAARLRALGIDPDAL